MLNGIIRLGSTVYTIKSNRTESENHFGCCEFRNNTITIDDTLPPENYAKTLVHEIVHAMLYEYGICQVDYDMNEDLTRRLSKPIYDFIHDNPDFGRVINELLYGGKGSSKRPKTKKSAGKSGSKRKGNGDRSDKDNDIPNTSGRKNRSNKDK